MSTNFYNLETFWLYFCSHSFWGRTLCFWRCKKNILKIYYWKFDQKWSRKTTEMSARDGRVNLICLNSFFSSWGPNPTTNGWIAMEIEKKVKITAPYCPFCFRLTPSPSLRHPHPPPTALTSILKELRPLPITSPQFFQLLEKVSCWLGECLKGYKYVKNYCEQN